MCDHQVCQPLPCLPVCQPPPCHMSSLHQLSISAPPTGLDKCFFFNSLVVRLPYSLDFWQFSLFFVFKLVVVLLLVVRGSKTYLLMSPSWPGVLIYHITYFWKSLLRCVTYGKFIKRTHNYLEYLAWFCLLRKGI